MDATTAIALVACVITALTAVVMAVWVVASVKGTTGILATEIHSLTKSIDGLATWVKTLDEKQEQHGNRLTKVEERLKHFSGHGGGQGGGDSSQLAIPVPTRR